MKIDANEKIRKIAETMPASIPIFEHYGVRFCCGQEGTLAEACREAGAPLDLVLKGVRNVLHRVDGDEERWETAPLPALVRFIMENHHTQERQQIETLQRLFDRVVAKHGDKHSELRTLQNLFERMTLRLKDHMKKEEAEFFPAFQQEVAPGAGEFSRHDNARRFLPLIAVLELEHADVLVEWAEMSSLSKGFSPPEDACTGYRALYRALAELEQYQLHHIHKEDHILFKRIKSLASEEGHHG